MKTKVFRLADWIGRLPETSCAVCWDAEASAFWRGAMIVGLVPDPYPVFGGLGDTIRAALGQPAPTWFDRHRADWERTGSPVELARMLRHVYDEAG